MFPVAFVMLALRSVGHGYADVETRVRAPQRWYPA